MSGLRAGSRVDGASDSPARDLDTARGGTIVGREGGDGAEAWTVVERTVRVDLPCVIHYVDVARMKDELRPVCGAWGDDVTWTTLPAIATCPQCVRSGARRTAHSAQERPHRPEVTRE